VFFEPPHDRGHRPLTGWVTWWASWPRPRYWSPRGGSREPTAPGCRGWHRASRGHVAAVQL